MDEIPEVSLRGFFCRMSCVVLFFFILRATFRLRRRLMGKTVSAMSLQRTKQYEFETFVREHRRIVGKVCYLYAMDSDDFDDL